MSQKITWAFLATGAARVAESAAQTLVESAAESAPAIVEVAAEATASFVAADAAVIAAPVFLLGYAFWGESSAREPRHVMTCYEANHPKKKEEAEIPALRGAWVLFPTHYEASPLTSHDREKIVEVLYPNSHVKPDSNLLEGRPFALPQDPSRDDSFGTSLDVRNGIVEVPRLNPMSDIERTLATVQLGDRQRLHIGDPKRVRAGEYKSPHEFSAARDALPPDDSDQGASPVVASQQLASASPYALYLGEKATRQRTIARALESCLSLLLHEVKESSKLSGKEQQWLNSFYEYYDKSYLIQSLDGVSIEDLRKMEADNSYDRLVPKVSKLLGVYAQHVDGDEDREAAVWYYNIQRLEDVLTHYPDVASTKFVQSDIKWKERPSTREAMHVRDRLYTKVAEQSDPTLGKRAARGASPRKKGLPPVIKSQAGGRDSYLENRMRDEIVSPADFVQLREGQSIKTPSGQMKRVTMTWGYYKADKGDNEGFQLMVPKEGKLFPFYIPFAVVRGVASGLVPLRFSSTYDGDTMTLDFYPAGFNLPYPVTTSANYYLPGKPDALGALPWTSGWATEQPSQHHPLQKSPYRDMAPKLVHNAFLSRRDLYKAGTWLLEHDLPQGPEQAGHESTIPLLAALLQDAHLDTAAGTAIVKAFILEGEPAARLLTYQLRAMRPVLDWSQGIQEADYERIVRVLSIVTSSFTSLSTPNRIFGL